MAKIVGGTPPHGHATPITATYRRHLPTLSIRIVRPMAPRHPVIPPEALRFLFGGEEGYRAALFLFCHGGFKDQRNKVLIKSTFWQKKTNNKCKVGQPELRTICHSYVIIDCFLHHSSLCPRSPCFIVLADWRTSIPPLLLQRRQLSLRVRVSR